MAYTVSNISAYCPLYDGVGWISFLVDLGGAGYGNLGAGLSSGTVTLWPVAQWGDYTLDPSDPAIVSELNAILATDATLLAAIAAATSAAIGPATVLGLDLLDSSGNPSDGTVMAGDTLTGRILTYDSQPVAPAAYLTLGASESSSGAVITVSSVTAGLFTITPVAGGTSTVSANGTSTAGTISPDPMVAVTVATSMPGPAVSCTFQTFDPSTGLPSTTMGVGGTLIGVITCFDALGNPGAATTSLTVGSTSAFNVSGSAVSGLTFTLFGNAMGSADIMVNMTSTAGSFSSGATTITVA